MEKTYFSEKGMEKQSILPPPQPLGSHSLIVQRQRLYHKLIFWTALHAFAYLYV
jgi:hypothetical protein